MKEKRTEENKDAAVHILISTSCYCFSEKECEQVAREGHERQRAGEERGMEGRKEKGGLP